MKYFSRILLNTGLVVCGGAVALKSWLNFSPVGPETPEGKTLADQRTDAAPQDTGLRIAFDSHPGRMGARG